MHLLHSIRLLVSGGLGTVELAITIDSNNIRGVSVFYKIISIRIYT